MALARHIRVLVVDDHTSFRQAVRTDLEAFPNIQIVGEAQDGEEAVVSAAKLQPTVVVMDINMPKMDGITATRLIKAQNPEIVVVGLSVDPKDYQVYAMRKAGALNIISKGTPVTELYAALQEAVAAVRPILVKEEPSVEKTSATEPVAKAENPHPPDSLFRTNIRILIVDDHAMFRQIVRSILKPYPNIEVVGEARDGDEAVVSVGQLKPAVVLMDISMQKMDGVTAARLIKVQYPEVAILGLSAKAKHYDIYAMQKAGAFEVLSKEQSVQELYAAIQRAVAAVQPVLIMEETPQQASESEPSDTSELTSISQPEERPKTGQEQDS